MIISRNIHSRDFRSIFHSLPDINVNRTNDLYVRHPASYKPLLQRREIQSAHNGNNHRGAPFIEGHPLISKVVVVNQSRFQAGLLSKPFKKSRKAQSSDVPCFKPTRRRSMRFMRLPLKNPEHFLPETLDQASITEHSHQTITCIVEQPRIPINQDLYSIGLDSLITIQVPRVLERGIHLRRPEIKPGIITPSGHLRIAHLILLATAIYILSSWTEFALDRDTDPRYWLAPLETFLMHSLLSIPSI
ncbi:acetyl-CoA synthetase-like protein [Penicillium cosmopolitanum]|uniref:Acetyl-CoA synthetase-like protein n=1 Tax=Penicillium cosmopolitanum TaxID=1131564 RepID=A0A9X0B431_9EURO|nr:acetyl-CoA synthetase-like protein [Penicillium cosmopolitanum]KAJ5387408.1 acetyl-CoA synthetase-like protein [Penicillium cosmopolitanum]